MRFTKHMVLLGGVLGVVTFFLPYVVFHAGSESASVSAFDVLRGIGSAEGMRGLETKGVGYVLLVFGPPVLLLVMGGLAEKADKFGRLGGVLALLIGLWSALMGGALMSLKVDTGELANEPGVAVYTLLAAGVLGALAGLLALIKPDRGGSF